MMPAAKHGDPQMGVDIHLCVVPPSPSPVPLPTPHMSVVFDPFDYVPFIGATVSVFGMKRATAGTGAIVVHIPPGFPFAPMLPEKDDELFMGSSTVTADGDPFSYLALPVLGCQVAGMPSPPRPKKKRIPLPTLLPTTFNLAIPTTVKVGGPPTISLMGMAFKGAFAGLGKLAKSKFGKALGDRFKKFRQKVFKNMDPGFLKCKVLRAEPVNILTGEVVVEQVDFTLQGMIPLPWVRSYSSGSQRRGACGHGWECPADARLEIDRKDGTVLFRHPSDGLSLFPQLPTARGAAGAVLELMDGALLSDEGDEFQVRTKNDLVYHFPKAAACVTEDDLTEVPISRISDLCGNWLAYERSGGRLVALRESGGRCLMVEHGEAGIRALSLYVADTGFSHTFVTYEQDDQGNLVAARDELGHPYCFAYDGHRMVQHTNRTGLSFYYEYDPSEAEPRVVHAWGDDGLYDYRFAYWPASREVRIRDSLGGVSTVQCDERGLPVLEIDPLGGRTIFEYDDAGRTTAVIDAANARTEYVYDERGNLRVLKRPDGSTTTIDVDAANKATRITNPNGAAWQQVWDERGLLVSQTSPLGAVTAYEYSDKGLLLAVQDATDARTCFAYDTDGQVSAVIDALGQAIHVKRDPLGNVLQSMDPMGRATRYEYDRKSRLVLVTTPGGAKMRCTYDAQDNLTQYEDEHGARTRFEYFGQGLLRKRHQPDGHTVEYLYDTEEQLIGVRNQRGERYQLQRDALGRVVRDVDFWGQTTTFEFDLAGNLKQSCDPLGRVIQFTTDKLGRIRRKSFAHPERAGQLFEETFDFDANGNLTACSNEHASVQRSFDAEGRLIEERQGDFVVKNAYDLLGRRIRRETSAGSTIVYEYDALGRPSSIRINDEPAIVMEHDAAGQVVKETLGPTLQRYCKYDAEGRLAAQGLKRDEDWLFHTRYVYDAAGNLSQRNDSQQGVDHYRCDPLGQIVEHIDPQGRLKRFFQDPAGDRLVTRTVERQQVQDGRDGPEDWRREGAYQGLSYRFDRAGNLVEQRGEGAGGPAHRTRKDMRLRWDANQRLVASTTDGVETRYGYDPLGRRLFKRTAGKTVVFAWDGNSLLAHATVESAPASPGAQAVGQSSDAGGPWLGAREYLYYPDSFVPLALIAEGKAASYRYHNDPNGCPTRLTSVDGDVVWSARYDVWGQLAPDSRAAPQDGGIDNPLRFQGQFFDEETGLHYNRHRYYDPHSGHYISHDPIGLAGGIRTHGYVHNPLTWIDPLGLTGCQVTVYRVQPRTRDGLVTGGAFRRAREKGASLQEALDKRKKLLDAVNSPNPNKRVRAMQDAQASGDKSPFISTTFNEAKARADFAHQKSLGRDVELVTIQGPRSAGLDFEDEFQALGGRKSPGRAKDADMEEFGIPDLFVPGKGQGKSKSGFEVIDRE